MVDGVGIANDMVGLWILGCSKCRVKNECCNKILHQPIILMLDYRIKIKPTHQLLQYWYMEMLNKNTLGVKKVRGQSEAALQTGATKNFDIS